jgi:hypothetical protein
MKDLTPLIDDVIALMRERDVSPAVGAAAMEIALIVTLIRRGVDKDVAVKAFAAHWEVLAASKWIGFDA